MGTNDPIRNPPSLVFSMRLSGNRVISISFDGFVTPSLIRSIKFVPPATNLAVNGLLPSIHSYPLVIDTRFDSSTDRMFKDLQAGEINVAVLWGPIGGYFVKNAKADLNIVPLVHEKSGPRMAYRIGMGVRHSDQNWKRELNRFISENQSAINRLLASYGVPLLDEQDKPIRAEP